MQPLLVVVVYSAALLLALALLYFFRAKWYWHVLSVIAAVAVGLAPPHEAWQPPDLLVGFVFVFLFVWGIGAPFTKTFHRRSRVAHHA
jgi:hypothetical protein